MRDRLAHGRRGRQRRDWRGVPTIYQNANQPSGNDDEQRAQEEIGGHHEGDAGFAHTEQVDDGDDEEDAAAKGNGMPLQGRNREDQRADAGRDAHGSGKNVIREQGRGGQKTRTRSEVEARYGVGTASAGIRSDGLAIREIDDEKQRDDGGADGNDVVQAEKAEGNEQGQHGFGARRGGALRVEAFHFRDQQGSLGDRPSGNSPQTLIVIPINLLENFHEAGGACVIHALACRFVYDFVHATLGVDRVNHFAGV